MRWFMVNASLENQGGLFFMKTPLTQLGIPKNIKKSWIFGQKPAFYECFWSSYNVTATNLENTQILFSLPFSQFLSNFHWKGLIWRGLTNSFWSLRSQKCQVKRKKIMDSRTWNLRGKYLKTGHLRFFSSENKKSPKNLLLSDDVLKISYFFVFGTQNCPKLFFSLNLVQKNIQIGPK